MENSPSCARPGKPDSSMAEKPQIDVSTPSRSVGQMRASVPPAPRRGVGLHEQVDRVVHGFADQRGAEAERDAVDFAEAERHRGDPGGRTREYGQQPEPEHSRRTERDQQQRRDERGGDQGEARRVALDRRPRLHGEQPGTGELERERRRVEVSLHGGEGPVAPRPARIPGRRCRSPVPACAAPAGLP